MNRGTILIVDDNENDVFFIRRSLQRAGITNPVQVVESGEECLNYLSGIGCYADRTKYPLPHLTFMDIKMPGATGFDVLTRIRNEREFRHLVVVMLTTSGHSNDIARAALLGANSYLMKPGDTEDFDRLFKKAADYWLQVHQHADLLESSSFHAGI